MRQNLLYIMILLSNMTQFNQMRELWILVACPNCVEPKKLVWYLNFSLWTRFDQNSLSFSITPLIQLIVHQLFSTKLSLSIKTSTFFASASDWKLCLIPSSILLLQPVVWLIDFWICGLLDVRFDTTKGAYKKYKFPQCNNNKRRNTQFCSRLAEMMASEVWASINIVGGHCGDTEQMPNRVRVFKLVVLH